jgi:hypothetical protein
MQDHDFSSFGLAACSQLLAIRLLLVPIGVGVGIGIGIDSDCELWLVLTHDRPSRHTRSMSGHIQFLVSKSHLLSFDSDSDTDPDPDYNPYPDRDAFVLY